MLFRTFDNRGGQPQQVGGSGEVIFSSCGVSESYCQLWRNELHTDMYVYLFTFTSMPSLIFSLSFFGILLMVIYLHTFWSEENPAVLPLFIFWISFCCSPFHRKNAFQQEVLTLGNEFSNAACVCVFFSLEGRR